LASRLIGPYASGLVPSDHRHMEAGLTTPGPIRVPHAQARKGGASRQQARALFAEVLFVCLGLALAFPFMLIAAGGANVVRLILPPYALGIALWLMSSKRYLMPVFIVAVFAFVSFLRRVADYHAGFVAFNPILLSPYIALLPTLGALGRRVLGQKPGLIWPFTAICICVAYGIYAALLSGIITEALFEPLRWILPIALCVFIMEKPDEVEQIRRALNMALMVIIPVLAIYGVEQYLNPPLWDVLWMQNVDLPMFGMPVAYQVRVFSMMNSPMSNGVFVVSGMILLAGEGLLSLLIAAAGLPMLALTLDREAWVQCAIGLVSLFLQAPASRKMTLLFGIVMIGIGAASFASSTLFTPEIRNQLEQRFSTFSSLGTDTSADDRLNTYGSFFRRLAESPLGEGFGANGSMAATANKRESIPLDSAILESGITFGVPMGTVYFLAMGTLVLNGFKAWRATAGRLSACIALVVSIVCTSPLGINQIGEASVLTWASLGILFGSAMGRAPSRMVALARKR